MVQDIQLGLIYDPALDNRSPTVLSNCIADGVDPSNALVAEHQEVPLALERVRQFTQTRERLVASDHDQDRARVQSRPSGRTGLEIAVTPQAHHGGTGAEDQ